MKKLVAISIAVSLVLGISVLAYAADPAIDPIEKTKAISITLTLTDIFGMQIWSEDYDQDITEENAVAHIYASTNHDKAWSIEATSSGLALLIELPSIAVMAYSMAPMMEGPGGPDDPAVPIPEAGEGTYNAQVEGGVQLSGAPTTIYTSAGTEGVVTGCRIDGMFWANPEDRIGAASGDYTGTVILTMTH